MQARRTAPLIVAFILCFGFANPRARAAAPVAPRVNPNPSPNPAVDSPLDAETTDALAETPPETSEADLAAPPELAAPIEEPRENAGNDDKKNEPIHAKTGPENMPRAVSPLAPVVKPLVHANKSTEPTALSLEPDVPLSDTSSVEIDSPSKGTSEVHRDCHCTFTPGTAYRDRRDPWGSYFGVQASFFSPTNYAPDFAASSGFASYYGGPAARLFELAFGFKKNTSIGGIGPSFTAGIYSASSIEGSNASLKVNPVTAGLTWALDTLFKEPYVVPYGTVGAYTMFYKESVGSLSVQGRSPLHLFYAAGLLFQLDWIDSESHDTGYHEMGLENTFLYAEMRQFLGSSADVPDFSTPMQLGAGLRLEF